jgi:hypothetical protein
VLLAVELTLAGEGPVPEQTPGEAQLPCALLEPLLVVDEDVLRQLGAVEEEDAARAETDVDDLAVSHRQVLEETGEVPPCAASGPKERGSARSRWRRA